MLGPRRAPARCLDDKNFCPRLIFFYNSSVDPTITLKFPIEKRKKREHNYSRVLFQSDLVKMQANHSGIHQAQHGRITQHDVHYRAARIRTNGNPFISEIVPLKRLSWRKVS